MPATTPTYALPYQVRSDPPDGAALGDDLAHAIGDELGRVDTDLSTLAGDVDTAEGNISDGLTGFPLWRGYMVINRTLSGDGVERPTSFSSSILLGGTWSQAGASWCREIPVSGIYLVTGVIRLDGTRHGGSVSLTLRENETDPTDPSSATVFGFAADSTVGHRPITVTARAVREFVAGDTIMMGINQTTGDDMRLRGREWNTYMEAEYLRP